MLERVDAIRSELNSAKEQHEQGEALEPGERSEFEARMKALEARVEEAGAEAKMAIEQANARTKRALDLAEEAQFTGYKAAVSAMAPNEKVKSLIESATSVDEVDGIIRKSRERREPAKLSEHAEKIRRGLARSKERSIEEDTHGTRTPGTHGSNGSGPNLLEDFGLSNELFGRLSGGAR
jgi:hypothetical protein